MWWKNKRKCPGCGKKLEGDFRFCPYCGEELITRAEVRPFKGIFEDVEKEFERIDRMFGSEFFRFPKIRFRPLTRGGGITVTIHSGLDKEPKVSIKTFGDYRKFEPEIKRKLGVKAPVEEVEEVEKIPRKVPKVTEEPETKIEKINGKSLITVRLPGVKSEDDVEIRKLEQSMEIRAFTDDKAYFTLVPIKTGVEILRKSLEDEVLKIEMG
ncbi:MAG: zinc ribbon domain-containing protein [Candidatus Aenigmarchaeota archaeon]|nr:zinc ribbon domain-containing protein [Candidatus Aenigmarchaeota archaeon]